MHVFNHRIVIMDVSVAAGPIPSSLGALLHVLAFWREQALLCFDGCRH